MPRGALRRCVCLATAWAALPGWCGCGSAAASPADPLLANGPPVEIHRAAGPIAIDGEISDSEWNGAVPIEEWYETQPGDNLPASLRSAARVAYDDENLYVAFELSDPEPAAIRAPLLDRDDIPPSVDFAGLYIDPSGEGKAAQEFAGTPRGVQYDGVYSEAAGPDPAPDFFWECAGRVHGGGWALEMRIPFTSLRYRDPDPARWAILMYRCVPRAYRYEYYSSRMPRDRACSLCNARALVGLQGLPTGSKWVAAPYATAGRRAAASSGPGMPLDEEDSRNEVGADLKWMPSPGTVIDLTWNPDFSQVESDVAQITANERFALFFDEKRPFFLESKDLFTTPLSAANTRSVTSPKWGVRGTGSGEGFTYTVLAGEDRGGGSVIIPGPQESAFALQDFSSHFMIGRVRAEVGRSFASFLVTGREVSGGGYNRVAGPDLEWWLSDQEVVLGQLLWSWSETPDRPDLAAEWDGRSLSGHAGELTWVRRTAAWDAMLSYQETSDGFRADNGFIPQVGFRKGYGEIGRTFYPQEGMVTRLRLFAISSQLVDRDGDLLYRQITPGFGFDSVLDSLVRVDLRFDEIRAGNEVFRRAQVCPTVRFRPGSRLPLVELQATIGDEIDFTEARPGRGLTLELASEARPTDNVRLHVILGRRRLDLDGAGGNGGGRLFTADVARLNATYSFSVRSWLRLIGQWVETERDPSRYRDPVAAHEAGLDASLTFAYKLDWQTVLYIGYGDTRALGGADELERAGRQAFMKISYAFQS